MMGKHMEGELIPTRSPVWLSGARIGGVTPAKLSSILSSLDAGDIADAMVLFDEMEEKDPHLGAVTQTRTLSAVAKKRRVMPASEKDEDVTIAKFANSVIDDIPRFREVLGSLMSAVTRGFAIAEIIWEVSDGMVVVKEIKARPQKLFTFTDSENPSYLLDYPKYIDPSTGEGVKLPAGKFIFHRNHASGGELLRAGLYRGLAWSYIFTNFTIKDWLTFMDIYGIPLRLGKYKRTADDNAKRVLKEAVSSLGSDASAVISEDTTIEFIQSAVSGNGELFKEATEYFNRQKSKRILGQTLTTESDGKGSYSLGKVHERVRSDFIASDCMSLDETLTEDLIKPLIDFNFGKQKRYPRVVTSLMSAGETEEKLEQVKRLVELGAKVPVKVVAQATGIEVLGDLNEPLRLAGKE